MKTKVTIVEVGLRDGLQNEKFQLTTEQKVQFAHKLIDAGIERIELGAFVRPDWIPQMAGSKDVIDQVLQATTPKTNKKIQAAALVPNERGMQDALETKIKEIAIFAAASESFSKKNINCTIEESFERFVPVMKLAKKNKIKVRGYLSTCFGCPYEGNVPEKKVVELAKRLYKMGCYEISIGDTIGVASPAQVESLFKKLKKVIPVKKLAGHFHDTRGTALANIYAAYKLGVRVFDTSLGGLGGCPYAPGSAGNVATEDVVYMFDQMKIKTGIDLKKLIKTNTWVSTLMGKELPSRVSKAERN
ncbi:MAG: hydroxymethylglutaryl-CoA lyase [Oligoflexia bacterium]|nr:MAG: hydroxymethylglutaryl-CoA lyase [Oligoflexia bacterium]